MIKSDNVMLVSICLFLSASSVFIFLFSYLWRFNFFIILISFIISLLISFWSYRRNFLNLNKRSNLFSKLSFIILLLPFLSLIFFIISPVIFPIKLEGFNFLRFTGVYDYNKHIYTTVAIYKTGIPPLHPYYPLSNFSYYYGFYIIPASISYLTGISPNISLVIFALFTIFLSYGLIYKIIETSINNKILKLLTFLSLTTGSGLDIIPTLLVKKFLLENPNHIELWPKILGANLMITNIPVSALWVPQHLFAASLALYTIGFILKKEKIDILPLSFICAFILFSSTFVSLTFFFWLLVIFIWKNKLRKNLIITGLLSILLVNSYIFDLLNNKSGSIFQFQLLSNSKLPLPETLRFLTFFFINIPLEFGFPLLLLLFLIIKNKAYLSKPLFLLGIILPLLSIIFISSSNWNDYGMRSILPLQIAIPILLAIYLEKIESTKIKTVFIYLIMINLLISGTGFLFEAYWRWKERKLFPIEESLLFLKLREEKTQVVSTLDNYFWTSYIPVLSFHPLYSPSLYDSRVYLPKEKINEFDHFGNFVENLFLKNEVGDNPLEIIENKNFLFNYFPNIIKNFPPSIFIIRNHNSLYLIKGWLSTYKVIFDRLSPPTDYSPDFSSYNLNEIKEKISSTKIIILNKPENTIDPQKTNKIYLKKDLYFLIGCKNEQKEQEIEILNRSLFTIPKNKNCAGQFFAPENEGFYEITEKQVLTVFQAFPVEIYNLGK